MPRQTRRVKDPCACKKKKGTGSRCGCGTSSRRRGPRRATAARSVPAAAAGPEPFAKGWNTYYPTHAPFGIDHAYGQRPMLPVVVPHNTGKPLGHAAGGNTLGGSSERAREARGTQTEPVPDPEVIEMGMFNVPGFSSERIDDKGATGSVDAGQQAYGFRDLQEMARRRRRKP